MDKQIYKDDAGRQCIHREKPSRCLCKPAFSELIDDGSWLGPCRKWRNDFYYGRVYAYATGSPFGNGPYVLISISSLSEEALHDWRDFQQIKNDIIGKEWEAIELYPAESRLVDPSNCFFLWCFPPGVLTRLGFQHRNVVPPKTNGSPQRPFPI